MGKTQGYISQRLVFGRFLSFIADSNIPPDLTKNLTEYRFRQLFKQTASPLCVLAWSSDLAFPLRFHQFQPDDFVHREHLAQQSLIAPPVVVGGNHQPAKTEDHHIAGPDKQLALMAGKQPNVNVAHQQLASAGSRGEHYPERPGGSTIKELPHFVEGHRSLSGPGLPNPLDKAGQVVVEAAEHTQHVGRQRGGQGVQTSEQGLQVVGLLDDAAKVFECENDGAFGWRGGSSPGGGHSSS
jgi:hypothetical protein